MSTQQHPNGELLGAYVLGVLDADERSELEGHTAQCEECRMDLATLRELEDALGEVPPEAFLQGPPEDGDLLLQRTLRQVRVEESGARRRRSQFVGLGAAASAVILFLGGYAASGGGQESDIASGSPTPQGVEVVSATDSATKASMTVQLTPANDWVRLNAAVAGVPKGERCRLVVVSKDGHRETAASWVVSEDGTPKATPRPGEGGLDGSAAIAPDDVEAVVVENDQGKQYVSAEL